MNTKMPKTKRENSWESHLTYSVDKVQAYILYLPIFLQSVF